MTRRIKKTATDKREHPLETRRPAGIQSMDPKLYESIQQAIRGLESELR
jgi:hypothetical protein